MLTRKQLWRKTRISHEVACNNNDVSEFSPRFIKYRQATGLGCRIDREIEKYISYNSCIPSNLVLRSECNKTATTTTTDNSNVDSFPNSSEFVLNSPTSIAKGVLSSDNLKKKKIIFNKNVKVVLIATRSEYEHHGMIESLWYQYNDFQHFKKDAIFELRKELSKIGNKKKTLKELMNNLYQPLDKLDYYSTFHDDI